MGRGGARVRSGPPANENSGRSARRGFSLKALPPTGRRGRPPKFPLPEMSEREEEVWKSLWKSPQAVAWSMPENKWMHHLVGLYTRVLVKCESPSTQPSLLAQLHRIGDQIGMTPAGLSFLGWKIAEESESKSAPKPKRNASAGARTRLKVVVNE